MNPRYFCEDERRHVLVAKPGSNLNGIDYLEVIDRQSPVEALRQKTLVVRFLKPLPAALDEDNVTIEGPADAPPVIVEWAKRAPEAAAMLSPSEQLLLASHAPLDHLLVIRTGNAGDYSNYRMCLIDASGGRESKPPAGFDPVLSCVEFSFKVECPSDFDCRPAIVCPPEHFEQPQLDYLAKDYASFRQLMLDRMAVTAPAWKERNPADVGIAVVETMAYAADLLSYYQDAVATEAYLGTARRRVSVRRHARLLDYFMHEGVNARAAVFFEVVKGGGADGQTLPKGTQLTTRVFESRSNITPDERKEAIGRGGLIFETLSDITLRSAHNEILFHTWGDERCCLPRGMTRATLRNPGKLLKVEKGDLLVFEEVLGPGTGVDADKDPEHRHVVRLVDVTSTEDPLFDDETALGNPLPVLNVEWNPEDALPFASCLWNVDVTENGVPKKKPVSVARGNIVLADHGQTAEPDELEKVPKTGRYRPRLKEPGLTRWVEFDDEVARGKASDGSRSTPQSVAEALRQDPRLALPYILVNENGRDWRSKRDLLQSDRFAQEFVVETEEDGSARLRFHEDGQPPTDVHVSATYRVGNGALGNVGAGAISHVVTGLSDLKVRNPMPAQGGIDREPLEDVRLYAPYAFRKQERAVTEADYAAVTERHPEVQKAEATLRWTGSWYTMFVTVDRRGGLAVSSEFEAELRDFLDRFRMAGYDLEIDAPRFVSLDIAMTVCVADGYFRSNVEEVLRERFSNGELPDGRRGFFHPDNFTFGQPVYLSRVMSTAMDVFGVRWVDLDEVPPKRNRFRRWREPSGDSFTKGFIHIERLEIARLDNDPDAPENGRIEFLMLGGL